MQLIFCAQLSWALTTFYGLNTRAGGYKTQMTTKVSNVKPVICGIMHPVGDLQYDYLSNSSCSWHCTKCDSANYSSSITQDLNSFTTTNRFSTLDTSQDCIFTPTQTSTPAKNKPVKYSSKTTSSVKIALIDFQSIREKKSQFYIYLYQHT